MTESPFLAYSFTGNDATVPDMVSTHAANAGIAIASVFVIATSGVAPPIRRSSPVTESSSTDSDARTK